MRTTTKIVSLVVATLFGGGSIVFAQDLSIRNNLAYDGSGTPNIGIEYPVSKHISLGGNAGFKPWPRMLAWDWNQENTSQWKHLLLVPEMRFYLDQVYDGLFTGVDLIYTHYNVGNVQFPLGMYPEVRDFRLQGDFFGAGIFAGYSWWLWDHWRLELEAGVGLGLAAYEKYDCAHCGSRYPDESRLALIPKLGLNVAYNVLPRHEAPEEYITQIDTVRIVRPLYMVAQVKEVREESTAAGSLSGRNHWVTPLENYRTVDEIINAPMDSVRYVQFPLDGITLYKDFADNATVLDQIVDVCRKIMADERDSLALIQIVGLASVEGDWKHNKWLGEGRAAALKQYVVRELGLRDSQVEAQGRGEAWPWFRGQISALLPDGGAGITAEQVRWLLDLIDNQPDPEEREKTLKANTSLYKVLKDNILQDQRNSGYVHIYYGTRPDPVAKELNQINRLIADHRYSDAVKEYESNPAYLARTRTDAEAANAYGVALFGSAVELEQIDTPKARHSLGGPGLYLVCRCREFRQLCQQPDREHQ